MEEFILKREPPETERAHLTWEYGGKEYNIASRGMLMYIAGKKGSFKSTYARCFIAAALSGDKHMGYSYTPNGKKVVLIDTETPQELLDRHMRDLLRDTGLQEFPEHFKVFRLSQVADPAERCMSVLNYIEEEKGEIDMVVIDVLADLVNDESSITESNALLQSLIALAEISGALVILTSHTNDSGNLLNTLGRKVDRKSRTGFILHKTFGWTIVVPGKDTYEPLPVSEFKMGDGRVLEQGQYIPFGVFEKQKIF